VARVEDDGGRKELLRILGSSVALAVVAFVITYQFVDPAPPRRLVMASGSEAGAYYAFGQRYREILARDGIELEVRATAGSLENIALLEASQGGADVAFVQGGTGYHARTDDLVSLASLYFEPLWLFGRAGIEIRAPSDLAGKRLWIGPEGSGTRAIALLLLRDNGLTEDDVTVSTLSEEDAVAALALGDLDVLFLVASPTSPRVQQALSMPGVEPTSLRRADAYVRRHHYLTKLTLPEGAIDLAANMPSRDVLLLAPTANLVAKEDLHPALVDLLLAAAEEIHGGGGLFQEPDEFPAPRFLEFPLSDDAERYFTSGTPFLRRNLPFWAATLADRLKLMLVPLIALVIPLARLLPPVYRWRVRSRVYRWYKELRALEGELEGGANEERKHSLLAELDRIDGEVKKVSIPWSYAEELYHLRVHIDYVRELVRRAESPGDAEAAEPRA